jgi:hypothetical protein
MGSSKQQLLGNKEIHDGPSLAPAEIPLSLAGSLPAFWGASTVLCIAIAINGLGDLFD